MLNEWATYDELIPALREARGYGETSRRNQKVQRQLRLGVHDVYHRVRTPKSKIPVFYWFVNDPSGTWFSFLVLQGSEGESFAASVITDSDTGIIVVHSHAINRYMERSTFKGTLEKAQLLILLGMMIACPSKDSDTYYIPFVEGVFLCQEKDHVLHVRTYVNDSQLKPNQRLWKRKSINDTTEQIKQFYERMERNHL